MFTLIISLILVAAVLLVLIILAQNSKGGGLSSQFGGSGASNMIGVKKTGDLLEKMTWSFIIVMFALTLGTNFLFDDSKNNTDLLQDQAQQENTTISAPLDLGNPGTIDTEGSQPDGLEDLPADEEGEDAAENQ